MRLLLVSTSCENPIPSFLYSTGIASLISYVKANTTWEVIGSSLFNKDWSSARDEFVDTLDTFKPDIVGFNVLSSNRFSSMEAALISRNKGILTIAGGVHASSLYHVSDIYNSMNFVIVGEGELTLVDFLKCYEYSGDLKNVLGVAYLNSDGSVVFTGVRTPIEDLDCLPIPDHSYVSDYIQTEKKAHLVTSRGCPGRCNFCSTGAFWGNKVRYKSAGAVVKEIEYLINTFSISSFMFHDDTFNITKNRVIEICKSIKELQARVPWHCVGRVKPVDEEMLVAMLESGCTNVVWGMETASVELLNSLGKGITVDSVVKTINLCRKVGMPCGFFVIVGHKGETQQTIDETVNFIKSNRITVAVDPMYLLPNTELYAYAKSVGFINDNFWFETLNYSKYSYIHSLPVYTLENPIHVLLNWQQQIAGANR